MGLIHILFHPLAFAVFPVLALLAYNLEEVAPQVVMRPILVSLALALILLLIARLVLRDWEKASLATTFLLILFFSYGHIYTLLGNVSLGGIILGRHRYLIIIYVLLCAAFFGWINYKKKNLLPLNRFLNVSGIALVILPTVQLAGHFTQVSLHRQEATQVMAASDQPLQSTSPTLPDVYYIVLDTYTRGDALQEDFNYDNTPFLDTLKSLGFYVAECSRSNYGYTQASIVAALNLNYLPALSQDLKDLDLGDDIWILLKQSRVRRELEALGYKTVAFDTGYEWSRLDDADVYLGLGGDAYLLQAINPFESLLIKSTAALIPTDSQNQFLRANFQEINFPYSYHVNSQRFILEQLPKVAQDPEPKFVFVHLLIPHSPFVFEADGSIVSDPGFYSGDKGGPINKEYLQKGYVNEVQFINQELVKIFKVILSQSKTPPIIVLHGDHGLQGDNRFKILNAYYLPGGVLQSLYPDISPVNSFRVIFNAFFSTQYDLIDDLSYSNEGELLPETSPACLP